jgi:hypothetical protein
MLNEGCISWYARYMQHTAEYYIFGPVFPLSVYLFFFSYHVYGMWTLFTLHFALYEKNISYLLTYLLMIYTVCPCSINLNKKILNCKFTKVLRMMLTWRGGSHENCSGLKWYQSNARTIVIWTYLIQIFSGLLTLQLKTLLQLCV